MIPSEAEPLEIIALAIKSEIDAANFYRRLKRKVKTELLRQKVSFLLLEEKKHHQVLLRLSEQRFGRRPETLPEQGISPAIYQKSWKNLTVSDLFDAALEAEKAAEAFYSEAKNRVEDKLARQILNYLSRVERSHAALILSEIDLLRHFPADYDIAAFHLGSELVHIGP